jgi:maltoporin
MKTQLKRGALLLATTLCSTGAFAELSHDFGSHGYFRIGTGLSSDSAEQEVFIAPGAGAKYRYGNENNNWFELDAYDTMRMDPEGPYVHVETMAILSGDYGEKIDFNELIQLYAEAGDFTTSFGNPKVWIGRRYYDRHDIHINDFFFLDTYRGFDGGGFSSLQLGPGKLALAVARKNADDNLSTDFDESSITVTRWDARYADIPVNENGTIMFWGSYDTSSSSGEVRGLDGYALGIMHTQQEFYGGFNKFMVTYGRGLGRHAGKGGVDVSTGTVTVSGDEDDFEDAQTFRIVNNNVIEISPNWSLGTAFIYEDKDSKEFDNTDQTWISLGVRPYWFISKNFRIPLELGWDYVDNKALDTTGSLVKATIAAEFALERGFWERPVLRLFGTYANWSDEFKGQIGGETYADETNGWSVGIQAEHWW